MLVSPIAHEDLGAPWRTGPDVDRRNESLAAIHRGHAARRRGASVRFVDLFAPRGSGTPSSAEPLTTNGIHPNERGSMYFARAIGEQLGWMDDPPAARGAGGRRRTTAARLRELACDKHYHERLLYRPTNTEYVWGRRAEPFGVVNFPPEMAQLERMIAARDRAIWRIDKPSPAAVLATGADRTGHLGARADVARSSPRTRGRPPPVEAKGTETSLGSLDDLPTGRVRRELHVARGLRDRVLRLASRISQSCEPARDDLRRRGAPLGAVRCRRIRTCCRATAPRGKLLILEDTDGDGHADQRTVFADELYIPTGFAVDTDARLRRQSPPTSGS